MRWLFKNAPLCLSSVPSLQRGLLLFTLTQQFSTCDSQLKKTIRKYRYLHYNSQRSQNYRFKVAMKIILWLGSQHRGTVFKGHRRLRVTALTCICKEKQSFLSFPSLTFLTSKGLPIQMPSSRPRLKADTFSKYFFQSPLHISYSDY